ncbi:maleylpyruvate isomerase family mycothiol-dependent enzyme [Phycicoccus sp. CSK15P-2]|uniref:maleylpyruvate isomerase family mycothiol-dependent enzyme n=1 Tax=Phycicoccus sp. CSK15P-2 TaxID=2807627 RepID=UPI0019517CCB|nr:maleylpyruvate isomerase family mycothiol-dependent enzyme [Phycicoccus sp. CSK15P-2]MBM6405605.1 maleylpyruvate isomerase family mycothiol-dependent enzyme [Phycicoccus sp. CSK15P-2]
MPVLTTSYLESLSADVARVADLLSPAENWAAPVPDCPGWTLYDLVLHIGVVHRMAAEAIETGRAPDRRAVPPADGDLATWIRDGGRRLLEVLDRNPTDPAWSFAPGHATVGFWQRRAALENAVHRRDVEASIRRPGPIDTDLAADGIDEVVNGTVPLGIHQGRLTLPDDRAVVLHTTDTLQHWIIGEGPVVASLGGPAEHLYLALWKRSVPDDETTWIGDAAGGRDLLARPLTP